MPIITNQTNVAVSSFYPDSVLVIAQASEEEKEVMNLAVIIATVVQICCLFGGTQARTIPDVYNRTRGYWELSKDPNDHYATFVMEDQLMTLFFSGHMNHSLDVYIEGERQALQNFHNFIRWTLKSNGGIMNTTAYAETFPWLTVHGVAHSVLDWVDHISGGLLHEAGYLSEIKSNWLQDEFKNSSQEFVYSAVYLSAVDSLEEVRFAIASNIKTYISQNVDHQMDRMTRRFLGDLLNGLFYEVKSSRWVGEHERYVLTVVATHPIVEHLGKRVTCEDGPAYKVNGSHYMDSHNTCIYQLGHIFYCESLNDMTEVECVPPTTRRVVVIQQVEKLKLEQFTPIRNVVHDMCEQMQMDDRFKMMRRENAAPVPAILSQPAIARIAETRPSTNKISVEIELPEIATYIWFSKEDYGDSILPTADALFNANLSSVNNVTESIMRVVGSTAEERYIGNYKCHRSPGGYSIERHVVFGGEQ